MGVSLIMRIIPWPLSIELKRYGARKSPVSIEIVAGFVVRTSCSSVLSLGKFSRVYTSVT